MRFGSEGARVILADLYPEKAHAAAEEIKLAGAPEAVGVACLTVIATVEPFENDGARHGMCSQLQPAQPNYGSSFEKSFVVAVADVCASVGGLASVDCGAGRFWSGLSR